MKIVAVLAIVVAGIGVAWAALIYIGSRFALRDQLQKADAIVALAGTRGHIEYLDGKIETAVRLYREGWAPRIIFAGRLSAKVNDRPQFIPRAELEAAAKDGRINPADVERAATTWDTALGARYMRLRAMEMGVPESTILTEDESLHTGESAANVANMLATLGVRRIILIASPFHQLRASRTFARVLSQQGVRITNLYGETREWNPLTWFFRRHQWEQVTHELMRIRWYGLGK